MLIKSRNFLLYVIATFLLAMMLLTILGAYWPLRDSKVNELDRSSALSLRATIPTEFDANGNPFWWVTSEEIELTFTNTIPETVKGSLVLTFSPNPCFEKKVIDISINDIESQNIYIEESKKVKIIIPISLGPIQDQNIKLKSRDTNLCIVNNGDKRDFVARLDGWTFE